MENLEAIAEQIHEVLEARTAAREKALSQARTLTRFCANAIRAVHRNERELADEYLNDAQSLTKNMNTELAEYPDLLYAGYTQDALKEYAEANIVYALVGNEPLPTPEALNLEIAAYLNGLAETVGELRRRCLDILRHGYSEEAERLLSHMDDIYAVLITMDYPNAITNNLRRQTDIVRSLTERTRGDLTLSLRQEQLERKLIKLEERLKKSSP
jgi:translin